MNNVEAFSSPLVVNRLIRFSRGAGLAVTIVGLVVLAGWVFDVTLLKSLNATWVTMKAVIGRQSIFWPAARRTKAGIDIDDRPPRRWAKDALD